MCGLAGVISKNTFKEEKFKKIVKSMTKELHHRGPDSEGIYSSNKFCAGFRRLSILDVSSNADQPFTDKENNYILVFNGEIYNFLELKKKYLK